MDEVGRAPWTCPECKRGKAPWVDECDHGGQTIKGMPSIALQKDPEPAPFLERFQARADSLVRKDEDLPSGDDGSVESGEVAPGPGSPRKEEAEETDPPPGMKWCAKHGDRGGWRPVEEFNKNRSRPDGLQTYCRECIRDAEKVRRDGKNGGASISGRALGERREAIGELPTESPQKESTAPKPTGPAPGSCAACSGRTMLKDVQTSAGMITLCAHHRMAYDKDSIDFERTEAGRLVMRQKRTGAVLLCSGGD